MLLPDSGSRPISYQAFNSYGLNFPLFTSEFVIIFISNVNLFITPSFVDKVTQCAKV